MSKYNFENYNVDRKHVTDVFNDYVKDYDADNPKVALKISHTGRVAYLCERIAGSLNLSEKEKDFAWLCGMLHDVGRFEQLRRYNTFADAQSVDHAKLGCEILFEDGLIRRFIKDDSFDELLKTVIGNHSVYILEGLGETEMMYAQILRDADKIDIFRVQLDTPMEEIYDVSLYELKNTEVTKEVMDSFFEKHATKRSLKRTAVDYVVGHISLAFELVYPESRRIAIEQGYLEKLMLFESDNEKTRTQLKEVYDFMHKWLDENV